MNLTIQQSSCIDSLYYFAKHVPERLSKTLYVFEHVLIKSYQKTLFITSLALLNTYSKENVALLPTGLDDQTFLECVNELESLHKENPHFHARDQGNLMKWCTFLDHTVVNSPHSYEDLLQRKIQIRVILSELLPAPPEGQLVRSDVIRDVLTVTMVIGIIPFAERENVRYPLNEAWLNRGLQIGLIKYILHYTALQSARDELQLENLSDELLSQIYANILWYFQICIFNSTDQWDTMIDTGFSNGLSWIKTIQQLDSQEVAKGLGQLIHSDERLKAILRKLNKHPDVLAHKIVLQGGDLL